LGDDEADGYEVEVMAGFGLSVINDAGTVVIDSEFSRLCVFYHGPYSSPGQLVNIYFAQAVKTQEPPLIFLRPNNNGATATFGTGYLGGPGNWVGVTIYGNGTSGMVFVAAFDASPVSDFGMRLWDGAGKLVFDSGTPAASFTRVIPNWTYTHTTKDVQGYYLNWYAIPIQYDLGDYFLSNNLRMWMMAGNNTARVVAAYYDFPAGVIRLRLTALQNPFYMLLPGIFGKVNA